MVMGPPVPATGPLTVTDPPRDVMVVGPPFTVPVVTLPSASRAMAPVPANSPAVFETVATPFAADRLMAPSCVTIEAFTLRSRFAARLTAPPAAPADPSICAFTTMLWPADGVQRRPAARVQHGRVDGHVPGRVQVHLARAAVDDPAHRHGAARGRRVERSPLMPPS
jgi:hypothetical protein